MANYLNDSFQSVYIYSKEILRKNEKTQYSKMLLSLEATIKETKLAAPANSEDAFKFWYQDVLPLVFSEDREIQNSSILALESAIPLLDVKDFQCLPEWSSVKLKIVETYAENINNMCRASDSSWYRVWCVIIRILDKEILIRASLINTLLGSVELGFRSRNLKVRAEAFICWKTLTEIFSHHHVLHVPKRIKLLCTPLKSSQSKSLEIAKNKFKVWWYFISNLGENIEENLETVLLPFLTFCFGPITNNSASHNSNNDSAIGKTYSDVLKNGFFCLLELLGVEPSHHANSISSKTTLNSRLMEKIGKNVIRACTEATFLMTEQPDQTTCFSGLDITSLWAALQDLFPDANSLELYEECLSGFKTVLESKDLKTLTREVFSQILIAVGQHEKFPFGNKDVTAFNSKMLCHVLQTYTDLFNIVTKYKNISSTELLLGNAFNLQKYKTSLKFWEVLNIFIEFLQKNQSNENIPAGLKSLISNDVIIMLIEYIKNNSFEFRVAKNAEVLLERLMWAVDKTNIDNDKSFTENFRELLFHAANAIGRFKFQKQFASCLEILAQNQNSTTNRFSEIVGFFIQALDVDYGGTTNPKEAYSTVANIINKAASSQSQRCDTIVEALNSHIFKLSDNQMVNNLPAIKSLLASVLKASVSQTVDKSLADVFKKTIIASLQSKKEALKEIKDLVKREQSDMFVIIPTVWSLNPEKLTERQKEKMKEKRQDIPAMYNELSQSQDSSIKPWTPNKIVIARGKDVEETRFKNLDLDENRFDEPPEICADETISVLKNCDDLTDNNIANQDTILNTETEAERNASIQTPKTRYRKTVKTSAKAKRFSGAIQTELNKPVTKLNAYKRRLRSVNKLEITNEEGNSFFRAPSMGTRSRNIHDRERDKRRLSRSPSLPHDKQRSKKRKTSTVSRKSSPLQQVPYVTPETATIENHVQSESVLQESLDEVIESSQQLVPTNTKKRRSVILNSNNNSPPVYSTCSETTVALNKTEIMLSSEAERDTQMTEVLPIEQDSSPKIDSFSSTSKDEVSITAQKNESNDAKIAEMDTECNTELISDVELQQLSSSANHSLSTTRKVEGGSSPKELTAPPKTVICMELMSAATPPKAIKAIENKTDYDLEDELLSPGFSPVTNIHIAQPENSLEHSIRTSPECDNLDARNAELLNSTLDVSPILSEDKNADAGKLIDKQTSSALSRKAHCTDLQPILQKCMIPESPACRPRSALTGRGAQIMNLLRNNQTDLTPQKNATASTERKSIEIKGRSLEAALERHHLQQQTPPKQDQTMSTPLVYHKDVLVFSATLPSSSASPSASILKRKLVSDSTDETESPAMKTKRVSFHDPPVSQTKVFVKTPKSNLNRCFMSEKISTPYSPGFKSPSFRRKSRVDSMIELAKFPEPPKASDIDLNFCSKPADSRHESSMDMSSLRWTNTTNVENGSCINDENAILSHVFKKYAFEDILVNYLKAGNTITSKAAKVISKELSSVMKTDENTKKQVLDILSEQHPDDFLEHAVQENLSSKVCEKLSLPSVIHFITKKATSDWSTRAELMEQVRLIYEENGLVTERYEFAKRLLHNHNMTNNELVEFIRVFVCKHTLPHEASNDLSQ